MITSVQSVVEQFRLDHPDLVSWGHTDRFFGEMFSDHYNLYNDPEHTQCIRSRQCLLHVLMMAWENLQKDLERRANKSDYILRHAKSNILKSLWQCVPVFLNTETQNILRTEILNFDKLTQQHRFLINSESALWALPQRSMSDTGLAVESLWEYAFEELSFEATHAVLKSTEHYLSDLIGRLQHNGLSSLQVNIQALNEMLIQDTSHPFHTASMEWLVGFSHGLLMVKNKFLVSKDFLPDTTQKFAQTAEQWLGFPPQTLSRSFTYESLEYTWSILQHIPDKFSEVLLEPGKTFYFYIIENLLTTQSSDCLFEAMGFNGSREWAKMVPLEITNFNFLGHDLTNLLALTGSSEPLRALVVGSKGSGKTALLRSLAHVANKSVSIPSIGNLRWDSYSVGSAHRVALRQKGLVVLDDARLILNKSTDTSPNLMMDSLLSGKLRRDMNGPEVWAVSSLEGIDAEILSHFDLIVNISNMPLPQRISLTREHFADEELISRVAQSCSTPGQILDLVRWHKVTGQTDWMSLSSRLAGVQRAIVGSKENEGSLPLSIHHPTPLSEGFSAVVGQDNIVVQAKRAIAGLKDPMRFHKLGGKVPKGILLKGGPGMGKTHLARAMAQEAGVPLLLADSAAMADTPELISKVFAEARRQSPCLLFLDELDAIGSKAEGSMGASPDPKRQAILNRVLMELDGFNQLDGVLVIGATHRSELLDSALVRSGRLGLHMHLENPTTQARYDLWHFYMKKISAGNINWTRLSKISSGMSPADIAQASNQAVMLAFADDAEQVENKHLVEAIDATLWGGSPSDLPIVADELHRVAVHEAGHALIAWRNGEEIERISVRPRSNALGFVRTLPEEGRYGLTSSSVANRLALFFGGLAAETTMFGGHASGVSSDLERCRHVARMAVRIEGMDSNLPAGISGGFFEAPHSNEAVRTAEEIENKLLATMREETIKWMSAHKNILEKFAQHILQEREIDGAEARAWLTQHSSIVPVNIQSGVELMAAAKQWSTG